MSKDCCDNNTSEHEHGHSHDDAAEKTDGGAQQIVLEINGMHCADCALNIERSVGHLEGVLDANVNYINSTATIYFDSYRVDVSSITKAIAKPGYTVKDTTFEKTKTRVSEYGKWISTS